MLVVSMCVYVFGEDIWGYLRVGFCWDYKGVVRLWMKMFKGFCVGSVYEGIGIIEGRYG